jgi:hypothetical protein
MAINERYALTPNGPNLLPAEVKSRELAVQKHDVRTAADSPMRFGSILLTFELDR